MIVKSCPFLQKLGFHQFSGEQSLLYNPENKLYNTCYTCYLISCPDPISDKFNLLFLVEIPNKK